MSHDVVRVWRTSWALMISYVVLTFFGAPLLEVASQIAWRPTYLSWAGLLEPPDKTQRISWAPPRLDERDLWFAAAVVASVAVPTMLQRLMMWRAPVAAGSVRLAVLAIFVHFYLDEIWRNPLGVDIHHYMWGKNSVYEQTAYLLALLLAVAAHRPHDGWLSVGPQSLPRLHPDRGLAPRLRD